MAPKASTPPASERRAIRLSPPGRPRFGTEAPRPQRRPRGGLGHAQLLAASRALVAAGIGGSTILQGEAGIEVVGEAEDGRTAVALAAELNPDVVVMDINMPRLNGVEATRQVVANRAGTKVLVLTGHGDGRFVAETLRAGASGYALKDVAFEEFAVALRAVAASRAYVSPRVTEESVLPGTPATLAPFARAWSNRQRGVKRAARSPPKPVGTARCRRRRSERPIGATHGVQGASPAKPSPLRPLLRGVAASTSGVSQQRPDEVGHALREPVSEGPVSPRVEVDPSRESDVVLEELVCLRGERLGLPAPESVMNFRTRPRG